MERPTNEQQPPDAAAGQASQQNQPQGMPPQTAPSAGYPTTPPPTSPPPGMAPGHPQQGQMQPGQQGQMHPEQGQVQPGQPGEAQPGPTAGGQSREPYPTDGYLPQDGDPDAAGLRRQTDPNQGRDDFPR